MFMPCSDVHGDHCPGLSARHYAQAQLAQLEVAAKQGGLGIVGVCNGECAAHCGPRRAKGAFATCCCCRGRLQLWQRGLGIIFVCNSEWADQGGAPSAAGEGGYLWAQGVSPTVVLL
jgi:hypothetical protein